MLIRHWKLKKPATTATKDLHTVTPRKEDTIGRRRALAFSSRRLLIDYMYINSTQSLRCLRVHLQNFILENPNHNNSPKSHVPTSGAYTKTYISKGKNRFTGCHAQQ